jgi:hypothetical protein
MMGEPFVFGALQLIRTFVETELSGFTSAMPIFEGKFAARTDLTSEKVDQPCSFCADNLK